jgi:hypothetical protein
MHPLQMLDERIEAAGVERVSADEKRLQREDPAQAVVAQIAPNDAVDAAVAAEPYDLRKGGQHCGDSVEGLGAVAFIPNPVQFGRMTLHLLVAGQIPRRKPRDLVAHRSRVARQVEISSVKKTNAIEGGDRQQRHMVAPIFAKKRK